MKYESDWSVGPVQVVTSSICGVILRRGDVFEILSNVRIAVRKLTERDIG